MIILPSLEIVPAKYDGSTLLSQIPIDGTGDFAVTRATSPTTNQSTRVNALGQIELVGDNVPRLDYPIGGGCPALLVEPAATNGIRNNSMVGAVVGSPGTLPTGGGWSTILRGLTQTIVGAGTENGIAYIDIRFSGTATSTNIVEIRYESNTQIVASSGQVWTNSIYLKKIADPNPPNDYQLSIYERDSGGNFVSFGFSTIVPTTTIQRFTQTRTLSGATTARVQPFLFFNVTNGSTYDFTVRIGYPQMETGSVATSVIPTTTQAITRAADVITDATASGVIGQTEGAIYVEFEHTSNTAERRLIALSDGTVTNRIFIWAINNILYAQIQGNSTIITNSIPSGYNKVAFAYRQNGVSGNLFTIINGGAVVSGTSTTYPATINRVALGNTENTSGTFQWNNRIRAAALYQTRLTDTQLALLTSPYTSYSSMASALSYTLG